MWAWRTFSLKVRRVCPYEQPAASCSGSKGVVCVSPRNSSEISGTSSRAKLRLTTDGKTSTRMRRTVGRDNRQERALRSALFREGYRFRKHYRIPDNGRRWIDVALIGPRVAVFVDGCFWHGCPEHGTWPSRNAAFWRAKIETNKNRDINTDARLRLSGWKVVRIWEHESLEDGLARVRRAVAESRLTALATHDC